MPQNLARSYSPLRVVPQHLLHQLNGLIRRAWDYLPQRDWLELWEGKPDLQGQSVALRPGVVGGSPKDPTNFVYLVDL